MNIHPQDVILAVLFITPILGIIAYTTWKASRRNNLLIAAENMLAIAPKSARQVTGEMMEKLKQSQ